MQQSKVRKAVIPAAGFGTFRERGEFQLTSCLEQLRQAEGMIGYVVKGKTFDIGMPDAYRQTMIDFRG